MRQLTHGDPGEFMGQLMRTNPQFAQFVALNADKTPEQAFRDNGLDYSQIQRLM